MGLLRILKFGLVNQFHVIINIQRPTLLISSGIRHHLDISQHWFKFFFFIHSLRKTEFLTDYYFLPNGSDLTHRTPNCRLDLIRTFLNKNIWLKEANARKFLFKSKTAF